MSLSQSANNASVAAEPLIGKTPIENIQESNELSGMTLLEKKQASEQPDFEVLVRDATLPESSGRHPNNVI